MVKYLKNLLNVVFEEVPDKISLAISITNCQNNCIGCHSPFLRKNIGEELTEIELSKLIEDNKGINCVLFLGEGNDYEALIKLSDYIKNNYKNIETAIYSGRDFVEDIFYNTFDYVKIGHYDKDYGPLNVNTTNQKMLYHKKDITYKFWHNIKDKNM